MSSLQPPNTGDSSCTSLDSEFLIQLYQFYQLLSKHLVGSWSLEEYCLWGNNAIYMINCQGLSIANWVRSQNVIPDIGQFRIGCFMIMQIFGNSIYRCIKGKE